MIAKILIIVIVLSFTLSSCSFNKLFYRPGTDYEEFQDSVFTFINLVNKQGKVISGIESNISNPKANILLVHGNSGNISGWRNFAYPLIKEGYNVTIFDYQGYGKSEGKPNHKNVARDAQLFLDHIYSKDKSTPVILWGLSLGGNLATYMAYKNPDKVNYLVVEAAFTSHTDIAIYFVPDIIKPAAWMFVKSPYASKKLIPKLQIPILIIHSTEDKIVPYGMGKTLYSEANGKAFFWAIDGEHCYGIFRYPETYIQKINEMITFNP